MWERGKKLKCKNEMVKNWELKKIYLRVEIKIITTLTLQVIMDVSLICYDSRESIT